MTEAAVRVPTCMALVQRGTCDEPAQALALVQHMLTKYGDGRWEPRCAEHLQYGRVVRVKALPAHERAHADAVARAEREQKQALTTATLPGSETWGNKPAPAHTVDPPIVRTTDPWTSHEAARRIEPRRGTRKANVLAVLQRGGWVRGSDLCEPGVGGSEGLRRCRELRQQGWPIERMPDPESGTAWLYRLP